MPLSFSRRSFFRFAAGTGVIASPLPLTLRLLGQQAPAAAPAKLPEPVHGYDRRATVSLVRGENRRKNITEALTAIDHQIQPLLKQKKYVVIKVNNVSTNNQLAATNADTIHGILDYLGPRYKGEVVVAESSAGDTMTGFHNFGYDKVAEERKSQNVKLVDLNAEPKYEVIPVIDGDMHVVPVRLAGRLLDPDAFVICSAILKTHNVCVCSLSVKNMCLGAPLHSAEARPRSRQASSSYWNDKRKYHGGVRQTNYNIMLTAQKMVPFWGVTVIDGFEGMEGNGPAQGVPVASRIAIASTDFIAADRVGVETMGVDPLWLGYLQYCWQVGLGQYDAAKIDVIGEKIADVQKKYQLHQDIDRELQWMGPMNEVPPKLG
jgi:uncharacterized protein (DUF362 family)